MNRIIKVTYQDGSELEPNNILPLEKSEDKSQQWRNTFRYHRQFRSFERDILDKLNPGTVEDYAKDIFCLVDESELDDLRLVEDLTDDELMEEVRGRKLLGNCNSIISDQFIARFSKIMDKENQILLDNLLTDLESKLNL